MTELRDAELVIFDCDGVLVDTEPLTNRLLAEVITEAGWPVTTEDSVRLFKGTNLNIVQRRVEAEVGRELPELLTIYRERMFAAFEAGIEPVDGAAELLDLLDDLRDRHGSGPLRCVASNGPQSKMRASLTAAGLIDRFDHRGTRRIYSAYDIEVWKPEPDLFLHAAAEMGVSPGACVVIEDSVSGIEAARAAGMPVVGLGGLTPGGALAEAGASVVIETLSQLADSLNR